MYLTGIYLVWSKEATQHCWDKELSGMSYLESEVE